MRIAACLILAASSSVAQTPPPDPEGIPQHDLNRPQPALVAPVAGVPAGTPGRPPSDAVVLFDGKDLSAWKSQQGGAARAVEGRERLHRGGEGHGRDRDQGRASATASSTSSGCARRRRWATARAAATAASSSMGRYEVQVLDSYENPTYADGQAGAIYGQYPPLVNACRAARRVADLRHRLRGAALRGRQAREARARHRLPQRRRGPERARSSSAPTPHKVRTPYTAHPETLPIRLQDHGNPMRFRNIWVRELKRP